jgi:uncharacterized OsmC-like protein
MSQVMEMKTKMVNGVAVDKLFESVDALRSMPKLASFKFRLSNQWIDGGHNRSTIKNFYGLSEEQTARTEPFILDADEPPLLLGKDSGPNPVEYLLTALAACVTTSLVYHAAAKGIKLQSVESRLEGDIDIRGFLGIDETIPRGYQNIRMKFKVKSDATDEQLDEIFGYAADHSPVYSTLTQGVKVDVKFER